MIDHNKQSKFAQDMIDMLHRYQQMEKIIEGIWLDIDPYNNLTINKELAKKLRDFMEFEDSE